MRSQIFPWLERLSEAEAYSFFEEMQSVAVTAYELGTSIDEWTERLERNVTVWRDLALQKGIPEPPPVVAASRPMERHYASYGYQKWVNDRWTNHCDGCDRQQDDDVHFFKETVKDQREGAKFIRGDTICEADSQRRWSVLGVGEWAYILRPLFSSSDAWPETVWAREAVEALTEMDEPAGR